MNGMDGEMRRTEPVCKNTELHSHRETKKAHITLLGNNPIRFQLRILSRGH